MQAMYEELGDGTGEAEEMQGVWECVVEREASEGSGRGEAEGSGVRAECLRCLHWTNKPLQPDFEAKEDRQT